MRRKGFENRVVRASVRAKEKRKGERVTEQTKYEGNRGEARYGRLTYQNDSS